MTASLVVSWLIERYFSRIPRVKASSVAENPSDFLIIDARSKEEFDVSHLPNSINIPFDIEENELKSELLKRVDNKKIVCYCSVGYRSSLLAQRIKSELNKDASNLQGSIFDWANNQLPLVNEREEETQGVHPYNKVFALLAKKTKWRP